MNRADKAGGGEVDGEVEDAVEVSSKSDKKRNNLAPSVSSSRSPLYYAMIATDPTPGHSNHDDIEILRRLILYCNSRNDPSCFSF